MSLGVDEGKVLAVDGLKGGFGVLGGISLQTLADGGGEGIEGCLCATIEEEAFALLLGQHTDRVGKGRE